MSEERRKRLIEVAFPLEEVSAHSRREKKVRHGHISTLHIWWARRPLAACRAFIYASLVDDPETDSEREQLLKEVADLASWDAVRHPDRVVRTKDDGGSGLTGTKLLEAGSPAHPRLQRGQAPKAARPLRRWWGYSPGGPAPRLRGGGQRPQPRRRPDPQGHRRVPTEVRPARKQASTRLHPVGPPKWIRSQALPKATLARSLPAQPLGDRRALLGQLGAGASA